MSTSLPENTSSREGVHARECGAQNRLASKICPRQILLARRDGRVPLASRRGARAGAMRPCHAERGGKRPSPARSAGFCAPAAYRGSRGGKQAALTYPQHPIYEGAVKITMEAVTYTKHPSPEGQGFVRFRQSYQSLCASPRHESTSLRGTHPAHRNSSLCGGSKGERSSPLVGNIQGSGNRGAQPPILGRFSREPGEGSFGKEHSSGTPWLRLPPRK